MPTSWIHVINNFVVGFGWIYKWPKIDLELTNSLKFRSSFDVVEKNSSCEEIFKLLITPILCIYLWRH